MITDDYYISLPSKLHFIIIYIIYFLKNKIILISLCLIATN